MFLRKAFRFARRRRRNGELHHGERMARFIESDVRLSAHPIAKIRSLTS